MIKNINDILVISDLDNTLLTAEKGIPLYNIEMIEKFQKLGGKFTVATGRSIESVAHYLTQIKLSAPAILYNGAVIYDYNHKRILSKKALPQLEAKKALAIIRKNFPEIGTEVMCDNNRLYMLQENAYTQKHTDDEMLSFVNCDVSSIKNNWIKVLFADKNSKLLQLQQFCESLPFENVEFVMTNSIYFEMMPKDVTKGIALRQLCNLMDIDIQNTVAIGDYYNDIELLKTAGLSVCVDNAPMDVKQICQATVTSCVEGGVGQLLSQIIKSCE
ncbi:MAG: HAD family hydrolase [Oscillospiraceae bacterium]